MLNNPLVTCPSDDEEARGHPVRRSQLPPVGWVIEDWNLITTPRWARTEEENNYLKIKYIDEENNTVHG